MFANILTFTIGIQLMLVGFGIIKNDWKTEELKKKHENRLRISGIIFVSISIIRILWGVIKR